MITAIEIEHFKCFDGLRLNFGALTLLSGFNGGGKSSAIQPLLILSQELRHTVAPVILPLNGSYVRLGTVGDIVASGSSKPGIFFGVEVGGDSIRWELNAKAGDRTLSVLRRIQSSSAPRGGKVADSLRQLVYISAVREGISDAYPIPDGEQDWRGNVGIDGRYAPYWLDRCSDDEDLRRIGNTESSSIRRALNSLMGDLFPGAEANVQLIQGVSAVALKFRLSNIGEWKRPANVGYGLSYAFPILVALLTADQGQSIIVDSPEAHLHPAAQSRMGGILARFAAAGVQVVVETHSDHLLNGVRLAVRDGLIAPDAVQLHFFSGATADGHGVISPSIDLSGRLSEWPDGFFDQIDKDISRLVGL